MISESWIIYIFFFAAIIVHEMGHYAAFRIYKLKPSIKFKWGMILMGENVFYELTNFQLFMISMAGIMAGYWIAIIPKSNILFLIYIIACMIDIVHVINVLSLDKKYIHLNQIQTAKRMLVEIEAKQ